MAHAPGKDMTAEELLSLIGSAERALADATARANTTDGNVSLAELGERRDVMATAALEVMRLRHRWNRDFGGMTSKVGGL